MVIAQIGPYPLDPTLIQGGVEASVYGLAQEQSKSSQVYVFDTPRRFISDCKEKDNRVCVYRFQNPGPHQKDAIRRINNIIDLIQEIRPSVCHIHGTSPFCFRIYKRLQQFRIPAIVTVHGLINVEKGKALQNHFSLKLLCQYIVQGYYEKRLLKSICKAVVDTEYVAETIRGYGLSRVPALSVIPQGINEKYFSLGCSLSSRTILSVGSISRRKGHLMLVKSFEKAAKVLDDIQLTICGILSDKDYYEEICDYISTLPCKDRISLQANVTEEELLDLYRNTHVFALHSQEESQGIVFVEAMAAGLPIVATDIGGIPFVVKHGETGFLTEYGDIDSFSEYIIKTMSKSFDWESMSDNCRRTAMSYSWTAIAGLIEKEYNSIHTK